MYLLHNQKFHGQEIAWSVLLNNEGIDYIVDFQTKSTRNMDLKVTETK